jgi:beta-mannosidase
MPTAITTTLDTGWEVAERVPGGRDVSFLSGGEKTWLPAQVPGHVHLDLVKAGVIGDPFFRMQEAGCRWVDEADWTYRTTFVVNAERLAASGEQGRHFLDFSGLDTLCRVYLNGTLVGQAENFFVSYRFDVTEVLREGENELRVEFDSALRAGQERANAYLGDGTSERGKQSYFNFGPRAFVRKPQYMFGWDWGPELISCGIWQDVKLVTVPVAEITDWRMDYTFTDPATVDITLTVTAQVYDASAPLVAHAALWAPGDNTPYAELPRTPGEHTVTMEIRGQKVSRWIPNGADGARKRYLLNLKVSRVAEDADGPQVVAHKGASIGFRTVEVVQELDPDGKGQGFKFRANGVDTFIKGANWIPDHSFPGAITEARLRERLTQARDAGFNMLRVWGGGLYETEDFYNLCDELGILVWQDFPFACSMYPDDEEWFVEQVRQEAIAAVRRLRHRPSLALWCGGNENLELFQGRWAGPTQATKFYGDRLIHQTLPAVLQAEDPRTFYWPNSPYGGENCTSEDFGDSHYWNVWHSKKPGSDGDWTHYAESTTRFSSEFGFAAPAGPTAWDSCTLPEDRQVRSAVSRWHDKTRKGYETYLGYIAKHYPAPQTWDDLLYYGQANQADALRFGVEHWRRLKGRCWGTLFWQINDCWPTHSWAVIDSAGEPKAAYYAARRFFAPLLLSLVRVGDTVEAYLVNDGTEAVAGRLTLRVLDESGAEVGRQEAQVTAPANAASGVPVATLDTPAGAALACALLTGTDGTTLAESILFVAEPKNLRLPDPGLAIDVAEVQAGTATLTVRAERFAGYVRLRFGGLERQPAFSDNWFHLLPGHARTITVSGLPATLSTDDLRARLHVRHL